MSIRSAAALTAIACAGGVILFSPTPGGLAAAPGRTLTAVVSVAPRASNIGQLVTAIVGRSTVPAGDALTRIVVGWGDRTNVSRLRSLAGRPTHRYAHPGRYLVHLAITDRRGRTVGANAVETVTATAGRYSGTNSQGLTGGVSYYVAANGRSLQQISIPLVRLQCTPGGASQFDQLAIPTVAVRPGGSFSATAVQFGAFAGVRARFAYAFSGRFTGRSAAGAIQAAGRYRETITYTDSAARTCTSNTQTWTATRDSQPRQTSAPPPRGSYSGTNSQGLTGGVTFYVSADRKSLQQISIPLVRLQCTPGGASQFDQLAIPTTAIKPDGSFSAAAVQFGAFAGQRATFRYLFSGNFHSVDSNGTPRAAGMYRETIGYTDSAARTCTSDNQTWTILRDAQPAQTTSPPPSGSYSGTNSQGLTGGVSFTVAGGRASLQQISIPLVRLQCTPGGATKFDQLAISATPIRPGGSFLATAGQNGTFAGRPAKFTYSFAGNFHGVNANGVARAAGSYRETITYTDTAARTCTSDNQTWAATRSG